MSLLRVSGTCRDIHHIPLYTMYIRSHLQAMLDAEPGGTLMVTLVIIFGAGPTSCHNTLVDVIGTPMSGPVSDGMHVLSQAGGSQEYHDTGPATAGYVGLLSLTFCIGCAREGAGMSPPGRCRMAICRTIGRRTGGSRAGM